MWRLLSLLFILPLFAYCQNEGGQYIGRGLLRAQGNIAMGATLNSFGSGTTLLTRNYITGNLEYYTSSQISIRGTSSFYLGSNYSGGLDKNHSVLFGALYHFKTNNNFDVFLGLEPGFAITHLWNAVAEGYFPNPYARPSNYPTTVNPIFTTAIGFNYYANRYFSVFMNARLVTGKHFSDVPAVSLNEIKFSFGLGWHLWARKGYCKFDKPTDL